MGAKLDLGILGPIEVLVDGVPANPGGVRQRTVLAVLALHPNQVVSIDRLVDDIWGETPPSTAVHTIRVFVSRLRGALAGAGDRLVTRPPGYVLELRPDELDADRFERLYEAARAAIAAGDAEDAMGLLRQSEALWRGQPLAEFAYEPFAQAAIARLDELRVNAHEELIDAQLALGRHGEVISELEAFVREHPFRERPRGQLMIALYRSGRQAQALEAFQDTRRTLVEELAVEPGEALRELEQAILRQDPSLQAAPLGAATAQASGEPAPRQSSVDIHLEEEPPAAVVRKTATVLVARLSIAADADPERTRAAVGVARERAEEIVVRHGGTFVAGLGGELAWVFGVPLVREDDAIRAVRAADELRAALAQEDSFASPEMTVCIGIASGEVIADSATDVFGDPLDRAVTLAHAAPGGQILVGDTTRRLAFNSIRTESTASESAWRLLGLAERRATSIRLDSPMVGRDEELKLALSVFGRAREKGEGHLLTVLGEAGIGKSRLVQELRQRVEGEASIILGRCLSYGQGVPFWPLREALTQASGEESREAVRGLLNGAEDSDVVADIVAAALGLGTAESVAEQIPWAFRRLLEVLAGARPLILVIDDVHWAETPLLDLVDYLVDWLRAPVLIVCSARPELLETRPGWGGGHTQVSSLVLGPLDDAAARRLFEHQLGQRRLSDAQRDRILRTAEGNPLFVEQLLQMSAEDPAWDRDAQIPGTIQSLLAARLDRLGPGERALIECAAVIGREFWPSAVRDLLPAEARSFADQHLRALVHRGLIHPDRSVMAGEEQLRFHHILIRDVAYRSTPKALRGELHERFADWLGTRDEAYDEFVGYHLESAFRYRSEVSGVDDVAIAVAERAVQSWAVAGRRALSRGDLNAAVNVLRGSADLLEASGRSRPDVLLDLGSALSESGDFTDAEPILREALEQAPEDAHALRARVLVELSYWRSRADPTAHVEEVLAVAKQAIDVFQRVGDEGGLARAWFHAGWGHWIRSRSAEMEPALERALIHAERAGEHREKSRALMYLARCFVYGPQPVKDAIPRCNAILERARGDMTATAFINAMFAVVEAMDGRFADARARWRKSKEELTELGLGHTVAVIQMAYGFVELLASRPELATPELADASAAFERMGDQGRLSSAAAILARLLYVEGRYDDADRSCRMAEAAASEDDVEPQVFWRGVRAKILARAGQARRAVELSDTAVMLAHETDFVLHYGAALTDRAEVMALLNRPDPGLRDLEKAVAVYERKGINASATPSWARLQSVLPNPVGTATDGGLA
ncbi:MAG: BTAD domain-containing putative transcriptional regulator [Solirubrobacteraceae bacterium]